MSMHVTPPFIKCEYDISPRMGETNCQRYWQRNNDYPTNKAKWEERVSLSHACFNTVTHPSFRFTLMILTQLLVYATTFYGFTIGKAIWLISEFVSIENNP